MPTGQVFISFLVENSGDLVGGAAARAATFEHVAMDSGASHLCLPAEAIARLGLPLDREVPVKIATGFSTRRIFRDALVQFEDRRTQCECIELPAGMPASLGAIPMEGLGIEPDLQNRRVRKLPMNANGTFLSA